MGGALSALGIQYRGIVSVVGKAAQRRVHFDRQCQGHETGNPFKVALLSLRPERDWMAAAGTDVVLPNVQRSKRRVPGQRLGQADGPLTADLTVGQTQPASTRVVAPVSNSPRHQERAQEEYLISVQFCSRPAFKPTTCAQPLLRFQVQRNKRGTHRWLIHLIAVHVQVFKTVVAHLGESSHRHRTEATPHQQATSSYQCIGHPLDSRATDSIVGEVEPCQRTDGVSVVAPANEERGGTLQRSVHLERGSDAFDSLILTCTR